MDERERLAFNMLIDKYDEMAEKLALYVAILGALTEKHPVAIERVDAWCREVAGRSESISQTKLQNMARDFLKGLDPQYELPTKK